MPAFRSTPEEWERLERCPLCDGSRSRFQEITSLGDRFEKERAVLCGECGLVFLDPRLRPEALSRYYLSNAFSREVRGEDSPSRAAMAYRDMRAVRRWRFLREGLADSGRCLEIGCGAGNFLRILRDAGYETQGIDPSHGYATHARGLGLDVTVGHFPNDLPPAPPFDMIFLFHVLEHVPDPLSMLTSIRAHLAPDGLFILEYPDIELAVQRRLLLPSYFERAHLFDFSRATLSALLKQAGFEPRQAFLDGPEKPYDRNVLMVCSPAEPETTVPQDPEAAEQLARALRRRLRLSRPLVPVRRAWRLVKGAFR